MLFFKRSPKPPPVVPAPDVPEQIPPVERRRARRFKVQPEFPLRAVMSFVPRDDTGAPVSNSRHGWNWKGALVDCSEQGLRVRLGPGVRTEVGETCEVRLSGTDYELSLSCLLSNLSEEKEGVLFGLQLEFADPQNWQGYCRVLETVALSAALKPEGRSAKPDESGYVVERYASDCASSLTAWRHPDGGEVSAFELVMRDWTARAATGQEAEYFSNSESGSRPATSAHTIEIHRWFQWAAGNLPPAATADVRAFMRGFAK